MKRLILIILSVFLPIGTSFAQREHYTSEMSLAEQLRLIKQKQDMFNLYINTQFAADMMWDNDDFQGAKFNGRQLRLEAKGQVTDMISYRLLQRLNTSNDASNSYDNLPLSIDVAGIGVKLSDKFSLFLGKQCAAYGGVEFDFNPIVVYEFADMIEYTPGFMTGVNLIFRPTDMQRLQFQLLNARTGSLESTYPWITKTPLRDEKISLVGTVNWTGRVTSFWNTMWSYSYMNQTKDHALHYIALGNEFRFGPVSAYLDALYSREGLNSKPLIPVEEDVEYYSLITKIGCRVHPKWNIFVKGMYEIGAKGQDKWFDPDPTRYSYGYFAGVEYYPYVENFRFFLTYIGRSYIHDFNYRLDNSTNRLSLGFIYQLPVF
ncbi:porin [Porphyromonas sp.]|uniref:porin n=1 Tax=Porphyromonas sp. TaxID=1924944 RepID=UPI0026DB574E|nr:porin [Porphyromonas sp.]MDO4771174.1 porin [Porphyromonas sp.]